MLRRRACAAFFALTTATLYFACRVCETGDPISKIEGRKLTVAFLLCEAGLLLTHYFAIPIVVALNLFALVILIRQRARFLNYVTWIGGQILAAVPMVVWTLIVFATPGSLINPQETPPNTLSFINQVLMLWLSGTRDVQGDWIALPWLALLVLSVALAGAWLVNRRSTRWVVAFAASSLVVAYAITLLLTSFHPRYALPYSVPLFVALGAALSNLSTASLSEATRPRGRRWLIGAGMASLLLVALVAGRQAASAPSSAKDDARGVAAYLRQNATARDVILLEANDYTLNYYNHGPAQTKTITAITELEAYHQLRDAIGSAPRVWLPHWNVSTQDARGYWPFLLELAGGLKSRTSFHGYELAEYEMQSPLREAEMKSAVSNGVITRSNMAGQGVDGALLSH
jgi:hypothetical protein